MTRCPRCSRQTFGRLSWCLVHGEQVDSGPTPFVCNPEDEPGYQRYGIKEIKTCVDCGKAITPTATRCWAHSNGRRAVELRRRTATIVPRW